MIQLLLIQMEYHHRKVGELYVARLLLALTKHTKFYKLPKYLVFFLGIYNYYPSFPRSHRVL